mmetsp:Transcript_86248/g.129268  ORF Transcript_86248/g.129268 Transcript_86248/m.129268 type:complete len:103 (-) Transcript_86248:40-348(-)
MVLLAVVPSTAADCRLCIPPPPLLFVRVLSLTMVVSQDHLTSFVVGRVEARAARGPAPFYQVVEASAVALPDDAWAHPPPPPASQLVPPYSSQSSFCHSSPP